MWLCRCDCGVEKDLDAGNLVFGTTTSCGCYVLEIVKKVNIKHGWSVGGNRSLYNLWRQIHSRCYTKHNPNYENYGGRGISICPRWHSFDSFKEDMGGGYVKGKTRIERENNDGNYEPSNCRWATAAEQALNKRSNRIIEFNGERLCAVEWDRKMGHPIYTISRRLKEGWNEIDAITKPVWFRLLKNRGVK